MISFENTEIAFKYKSSAEVKRARFLFWVISNPLLVNIGKDLTELFMDLEIPVKWIIKPTIFNHFCGGESIKQSDSSIEKMAEYGVRTVLDYSVEGKEKDEDIEAAYKETMRSIRNAAVKENIPFAVFKPTAFTKGIVLEKLSADKALTPREQNEADLFYQRIEKLCAAAKEYRVPILIDAEDYCYQKAIDNLVTQMMIKFNTEEAIVFNTLQMYRKDRLAFLVDSLKHARKNNYYYGVKFVRGAYMEKERLRAESLNYPSPIHDCKEGTDSSFNEGLKIAVDNFDITDIFCGTHNEYSCQYLCQLMEEKSIPKNSNKIWFSQLYGMSDHISFNLAKEGYNVTKYMPYGPLKNVLPYLMRRAEENTSVAGQSGRELTLLKKELIRRNAKK